MVGDNGPLDHNGLGDEEIRRFLERVNDRYGYDFRNYALGTVRRRLADRLRKERLDSMPELLDRVINSSQCLHNLVQDLSITVSAMFRDAGFFLAFRQGVVPLLKTYPFVRIWHAGCGLGEEVYSMAIILQEEGLLDKSLIYATDISDVALRRAKQGIFPLGRMREYTRNYIEAGGREAFSSYYTAQGGHVIFKQGLKKNMVFSRHNLVTDGLFNRFNVIVCRNVMIYFDKDLQARVNALFYQSLVRLGFLGLGRSESLNFSPHASNYQAIDTQQRLYRKVR